MHNFGRSYNQKIFKSSKYIERMDWVNCHTPLMVIPMVAASAVAIGIGRVASVGYLSRPTDRTSIFVRERATDFIVGSLDELAGGAHRIREERLTATFSAWHNC